MQADTIAMMAGNTEPSLFTWAVEVRMSNGRLIRKHYRDEFSAEMFANMIVAMTNKRTDEVRVIPPQAA